MKTLLISFLAGASMLLTGCVGTGPNTQRGAVAGGTLGAIAGAVIGHNSGSHNTASGAAIGAAVGAIAGGTLGNAADHERGTIYTSHEQAESSFYTENPISEPPLVREVIVAPPGRGYVWIPGCWVYNGHDYAWRHGYWTRPPHPRHSHYVPPHWERSGYGHVYVRGYWRR